MRIKGAWDTRENKINLGQMLSKTLQAKERVQCILLCIWCVYTQGRNKHHFTFLNVSNL